MSCRRFLSLVLVLGLGPVVSACSSPGGSASGELSQTAAATATGGTSTLMVRAQFETYSGRTALEAVQQFNRRWLRTSRGGAGGGAAYARVVIDGARGDQNTRGEFRELARLRAVDVDSMRFLDGNDANRKYGPGHSGGMIEVTLRRR